MRVFQKKDKYNKNISANDVALRLMKKRINKIRRGIFILFVLLSSSQLVVAGNVINYSGPIIEDSTTLDLTPQNVYNQLVAAGVKHPEIVVRQAILETGWFKCKKCSLSKNNIFGFYYKKKYLEFDHWTEAVAYYKKWQDKRYNGGDYYKFLKKVGYATSPTYESKLQSIKLKGRVYK